MPAPCVPAAWAHRCELQDNLQSTEARTELLRERLDDANAAVHAALLAADAARAAFEEVDMMRSRLQEELSALPPAFDPELVAALPLEILQAIFRELAFEDDPLWTELHTGCYNRERAMVPWRLAAVCRKWRTAALNMPEIWTYISVPTPVADSTHFYGSNLLTRTKVLLERSTTRPLDILFTFDNAGCWMEDLDWFQPILLAVAHCASRWRRAHFNFPKGVHEWDLVFLRQPTPLLEEIAVSICGGDVVPWKERYPAYLPFCPSLRTLWSTAVFVPPQCSLLSLISAHLVIDERCQKLLWPALCHMTMLRSLSIVFRSPQTESNLTPPSPHLRLPHLHTLELSGYFSPVSMWTATLDIPQLNALVLRAPSSTEILALTAFFSSACATIVDLQLGPYPSSRFSAQSSQLPALGLFVHLQRVAFHGCQIDSGFFQALHPLASPMVWPALKSVSLHDPPEPGSPWFKWFFLDLTSFVGYRVPTRHFNNGGQAPLAISVTGIDTESLDDYPDFRSWFQVLGYVLGPSNCRFTDSKGETLRADFDPNYSDVEDSEPSLSDYDSQRSSSDSSESEDGEDTDSDGGSESGSERLLVVSGANWDSDNSDDRSYIDSQTEER